jgi:hypothetical protein
MGFEMTTSNSNSASRTLPSLPDGFEDLSCFVTKWAVEPLSKRQKARVESSLKELREFYETTLPKADKAIAYLNQFDLEKLSADSKNLMNLMLSLMEVAHSIELWKSVDQPDAFPMNRLELIIDK